MKYDLPMVIMMVLVMGILYTGFYSKYKDGKENYYICIDTQGNTIYCEDAKWTKGGLFGVTEDGTTVQITSYKKIKRVEE